MHKFKKDSCLDSKIPKWSVNNKYLCLFTKFLIPNSKKKDFMKIFNHATIFETSSIMSYLLVIFSETPCIKFMVGFTGSEWYWVNLSQFLKLVPSKFQGYSANQRLKAVCIVLSSCLTLTPPKLMHSKLNSFLISKVQHSCW